MKELRLTRRQFLKDSALFVAGSILVGGCQPQTSTSIPAIPTLTEIPIPTLIPVTPESIGVNIPGIDKVITRKVVFQEAPILPEYEFKFFNFREKDGFYDIFDQENLDTYVYYNNKKKKLYSGFGSDGREQEILGWQNVSVIVGSAIFTDIPGKFAYKIVGSKQGDDPDKNTQIAFVFVDIPNSQKTFIEFSEHSGFALASKKADLLAINVIDLTLNEKDREGIYLLDTNGWNLIKFIRKDSPFNATIQISDDGSLIYDQHTKELIDTTTGQIETIDWPYIPFARSMVPGGLTGDDITSPDLKYISKNVITEKCDTETCRTRSNIILFKTPNGFITIEEDADNYSPVLQSITNEGIAILLSGIMFDLNCLIDNYNTGLSSKCKKYPY